MKTKRYLVQGFLLLLCSLTAMAGSPSEGKHNTRRNRRNKTGNARAYRHRRAKKKSYSSPLPDKGKQL